MSQQFFNNASGASLLSTVSSSATSFTLQSGEGSIFPLISGNYFYATLGTPTLNEVVKVTARSEDTFTCESLVNEWESGTQVSQFVCAELMNDMAQADGDGQILSNHEFKNYYESISFLASSNGELTLDLSFANTFAVTITEDITTLIFNNPAESGVMCSFTLELTQDSTGGWEITWPSSVIWMGDISGLSTLAGVVSLLVFYTRDGGITWRGMLSGQASV